MRFMAALFVGFALVAFPDVGQNRAEAKPPRKPPGKPQAREPVPPAVDPEKLDKATFGAGCFWCSEAVFQQLKGVHSVVPGYSGGATLNPTYDEVSTGMTGHAEVVQIAFDPAVVTYDELLEVFFKTHDPTTLNRQGPDEGTQYRSVIFYHDDKQKELAELSKQAQRAKHTVRRPIVTEIVEFSAFYPAEAYHQNYFNRHREEEYCAVVVQSKLSKVKKAFPDKVKQKPRKPRSR